MSFKKVGEASKILEVMDYNEKKAKKVKCKKCGAVLAQVDNGIVKVGTIYSFGKTLVECKNCGKKNLV